MTLSVKNLNAWYGSVQVLRDVSFELQQGKVTCLFGRNGAGKTTALKSIMGLVKRTGDITLDGKNLTQSPPHQIPKHGIACVPQGRRLFSEMTVAENLTIGLMTRNKPKTTEEKVLDLFPPLKTRLQQISGTLSGGEQQMLAMARALCIEPNILLLDEPTEGLMPSMISAIRDVILRLREQNVAVLLVEQRVEAVISIADDVVFVENGKILETVKASYLEINMDMLNNFMGIS